MKITKRQLKRMIAEAMPAGGVPDVVGATTGVPGGNIQNLVDEYKEWATDFMGTPSGANSSSVLATFLVDRGLDQGPMADDIIKDMSSEMRFDRTDVKRDVTTARKEHDAGASISDQESFERSFKEGKMRITKGRLKRIIKEERVKLMTESMQSAEERLFNALDEFVNILDEQMGYGVENSILKGEVLNFVDGYFEQVEIENPQ